MFLIFCFDFLIFSCEAAALYCRKLLTDWLTLWQKIPLNFCFLNPSLTNSKQVGQTPESNSNFKCILGSKIFGVKKICVQKNFASKKLFGPRILVRKKFWVKKECLVQQNLGQENFLGPTKFLVRKNFRPKNVGSKNFPTRPV